MIIGPGAASSSAGLLNCPGSSIAYLEACWTGHSDGADHIMMLYRVPGSGNGVD